jgi:exopolysaccharide production protein ExoZ
MPHNRRTFASFQAARGIAALMVVFMHATNFAAGTRGLWEHFALNASLRGMVLGVELFFVLSGLVILSAHWDDIGRPSRLPSFLWKRFRRIYPMYWIALALTIVAHAYTPGTPAHTLEPLKILSSFLLIHIHSPYSVLTVSWSLFHEVLFYAVFALLICSRRVGLIVLLLWISISAFYYYFHHGLGGNFLFSQLHLLFGFGMAAAWLLRKGRVSMPRVALLAGSTIFVAAICLLPLFRPEEIFIDLLAGLGAALMLIGAAELERRGKLTVPAWLCFVGDASYSIYLFHFMVISGAARPLFQLDRKLHLPVGVWILTLFLIGTVAGCLTYVWVERPILRLLGKSTAPRMQAS